MSHTSLLDKLKAAREEILKGEVGALLHDIGKLHSKFYQKHCEGGTGEGYPHHKISNTGIISKELIDSLKNTRISINSADICLLELIEGHHPKRGENSPDLASLLIKCDRIDSGDDKGVVRKKQPINNTVIVSAFGKEKSKIDLTCLDNYLKELDENLNHIFSLYVNRKIDVHCFRDSVLKCIEELFSNALGETRIPANDVTLFDHSFSTASLYKTQLARAVLEGKIEGSEEWRVFGIFWNGTRFVSQARKVADALKRQENIKTIKEKLKHIFEVKYPIGDAIFEDNNSIFFTFPTFNYSEKLAAECMEKAVEIIRKESDNDLWPIFALSQPRRSPTVIAQMMKFFDEKKLIEKESPVLCIQDKNSEFLPYTMLENPTLKIPGYNKKYDVCPVCRIRVKKVDSETTCEICLKRRKGRIRTWVENRDNTETIWMDEVADENNRVALVSVEFDIGDWLNGEWLHSLWIQTIQDWIDNAEILKDQKRPEVAFLKKEGIIRNNITEIDVEKTIELLRIIATKSEKPDQRKNIFLTFFNKRESPKDKDLSKSIQDIKSRSIINREIQYKLFAYFFLKHSSPARLRRIWRETENFIVEIQKQIHAVVKWPKRIVIEVKDELAGWDDFDTGKIIGLVNLSPDNLPVTYLGDKRFITIVSFDGYKSEKSNGLKAMEGLLKNKKKKEPVTLKKDDSDREENILISNVNIEEKTYLPTITITKSPYQFQMLVPATSVSRVLEIVSSLYDEWFSKVKGKLPLKLGVLVANRKFPLYVLLDSASKMLRGEEFKKLISMEPYWDVNGQRIDTYYDFYPTDKNISPEKLVPVKNGREFYLSPGYFDFDLLGGTADRGRIFYKVDDSKPIREEIAYGWIKPRPHYFHKIKDMLKLRGILGDLTKTQVNGIERALITKLEEWKDVDSDNKNEVFHEFAKAVIIDAFRAEKWWKMSSEKRGFIEDAIKSGLLLDTIQFFNHVLKIKIGGDKDE